MSPAMRRAGGVFSLLFLPFLFVSGCGTSGSRIPVTEMTAKTNSEGVQQVEIEAHSFYFKPNRVVVEAGKPVELIVKFKNKMIPHNLTCGNPDVGISVSVSAGIMSFHPTKRARFTPTKPGEYEFFCNVGGHHKKGMRGTLVVK